MPVVPGWLTILCTASLALGIVCALVVLIDVIRHPQHMTIMAFVWPVCALFGTVLLLRIYFRHGRQVGKPTPAPFPIIVAKGTLHCGGGCTIGDIVAEWLAYAAPVVAIPFGWHFLFANKTFAVWVLDFVLAFAFGIIFQYFAIVPMRHLRPWNGILAAIKADALSLAAWQIGMYGAMALLQLVVFPKAFGGPASVASVEFWAGMQLAMIAGFVTSYPMNWWLIRAGIKERM